MPISFRDFVSAAYAKGKVRNLTIADGVDGVREAGVVMAEMTAKAVALIDGIANPRTLTAADREAGAEAQRLNLWLKGLDYEGRSAVIAAMERFQARG